MVFGWFRDWKVCDPECNFGVLYGSEKHGAIQKQSVVFNSEKVCGIDVGYASKKKKGGITVFCSVIILIGR